MSQLVQLHLESGDLVYVEGEAASRTPVGAKDKVLKGVEKTFEAALDSVKPAAGAVLKAFQELNQPDEISLELGIKFESEVSSFVVTGKSEAAFRVSLTWKRPES